MTVYNQVQAVLCIQLQINLNLETIVHEFHLKVRWTDKMTVDGKRNNPRRLTISKGRAGVNSIHRFKLTDEEIAVRNLGISLVYK